MKKIFARNRQQTTTALGFPKDNYQIITVNDLAERLEAAKPNEEIPFYVGDMTSLLPWEKPQNLHYISKNTRYGCECIIIEQVGGRVQMKNTADLVPPERGQACAWDYAAFIVQCLFPYRAQRVIIDLSQLVMKVS